MAMIDQCHVVWTPCRAVTAEVFEGSGSKRSAEPNCSPWRVTEMGLGKAIGRGAWAITKTAAGVAGDVAGGFTPYKDPSQERLEKTIKRAVKDAHKR